MIENDISKLVKLSKEKDLAFSEVHKLYELKTTQYLTRDYNNGKSVDWMRPEEQYARSFRNIKAYINKRF